MKEFMTVGCLLDDELLHPHASEEVFLLRSFSFMMLTYTFVTDVLQAGPEML